MKFRSKAGYIIPLYILGTWLNHWSMIIPKPRVYNSETKRYLNLSIKVNEYHLFVKIFLECLYYMNWLYMKRFALSSRFLIFAYFSLLFQNITTYSLEIWVQRLKPKHCGMPSRPLGKYRKSTTIYHIFTVYYVLHRITMRSKAL